MSGKLNLNNHFKNGKIDLSLSELKEIPVKELAQFKKATNIDLSNNKISNVGKNMPITLTHIIELNLSKNLLKSLPENFGELVNLKHLDLYNNKIQTLPLSFGKLKKLTWLDVKGNPLAPKVAQITGPCSNSKECEAAAKNTVKTYQAMLKEVENGKKTLLAEQKKKEKDEKASTQTKQAEENSKSKKNKNKENGPSSPGPDAKAASNDKNKNKQQNGKQQQQQNGKQGADKKNNKQQQKNKNDKKVSAAQPKSFFGKVFALVATLFKLMFISTIVTLGAIFVLSLLDENKFKVLMEHIRGASQNYISRDLQNSITRYTLSAGSNLKIFGNAALKKMSDLYIYLTTDETLLAYRLNIQDYIHVSYIRVRQLIDSYINTAASSSVPAS